MPCAAQSSRAHRSQIRSVAQGAIHGKQSQHQAKMRAWSRDLAALLGQLIAAVNAFDPLKGWDHILPGKRRCRFKVGCSATHLKHGAELISCAQGVTDFSVFSIHVIACYVAVDRLHDAAWSMLFRDRDVRLAGCGPAHPGLPGWQLRDRVRRHHRRDRVPPAQPAGADGRNACAPRRSGALALGEERAPRVVLP
jgi:hypothetical protein